MSQASLPGLAPELKIQIFKSMDSFSSVTVLSSTSRTFYSIWKSNTKSVCGALLQQIIECPVEAKMLLDAQDSSQQAVDAQDFDTNQEEESSPFQKAIEHSQRAFVNARTASVAFKDFDLKASRFSGPGRELSPTERIYFIQAYYRAMTMALISCEGSLESLIASWNMLEFQRFKEVLNYLLMLSPKQLRQGLGISYVDGSEPAGEWNKWNITLKFKIARCRMQSLDQELRVVSPSDYLSKPPRAPMCYFIAYEHLPKTTDSPRGAHLAEILHLLPKEALRRALNLKDAEFRAKKLQWVRGVYREKS